MQYSLGSKNLDIFGLDMFILNLMNIYQKTWDYPGYPESIQNLQGHTKWSRPCDTRDYYAVGCMQGKACTLT